MKTPSDKPTEPGGVVERLAAAEVGSRELDCALAVLLDGYIEEPSRYGWEAPDYAYIDDEGGRVSPGHGGDQLVPHYTTSLDAALALAERILDPLTALGLLHAVIEHVGSTGQPTSRIAPLFCAAILRAHPSDGESK